LDVQSAYGGLRVQAFAEAPPFYLRSADAGVEPAHTWYRNYELAVERSRGLDHQEGHLHAGTFHAELRTGEAATLVASTDPAASLDGKTALQAQYSRDCTLLGQCEQANPQMTEWPAWIKQLTLAADQFVIAQPLADVSEGSSVIAGYPWFGEWGRDTMIALPGLLLATGRPEVATDVLRTYGRLVDRGMLPNRFPEAGEAAEYNSVDAALWFFEAVRQYYAATHDLPLVREIFPALTRIISEYARGTRYNIHVDSTDGLLYAGDDCAPGQARGGECALVKRARHPDEIRGSAGRICGPVRGARVAGSPGLRAFLESRHELLL
jgi:predicted glycogen debranching enzyme